MSNHLKEQRSKEYKPVKFRSRISSSIRSGEGDCVLEDDVGISRGNGEDTNCSTCQ